MRAKTISTRIPLDHYPTPAGVTRQLLGELGFASRSTPWSFLDPACGEGSMLRVAIDAGATTVRGLEVDAERAARAQRALSAAPAPVGVSVVHCDALGSAWPLAWMVADVLVTNPPYSHALEFAARAASWAHEHQRPAALLMRLAFAESARRISLHRAHPADIWVLPKRPKFRADRSGTDSSAYAWWVWGPGRGGRWHVLPLQSANSP